MFVLPQYLVKVRCFASDSSPVTSLNTYTTIKEKIASHVDSATGGQN